MSKILEMIEKRNEAWNGAKAFVESKKDKDGLLSKDDAATYSEMEQKVKNFSAEIERLQAMDAMEKELNKPVNTPITSKPMSTNSKNEKVKTGRARDEYKEAMLNGLRSKFRSVSDVLQEGVDADGGYLVPVEYDKRLIEKLEMENIMRKLGTRIETSGEHKINIAATDVAAAWTEEGGTITFGDSKFKQMLLDAHKLAVAIKVTEELLYDSMFDIEDYILNQFGRALANAEEDAFLNGDGKNKPTGLFHKTEGGTYIDEVSTIKSDDIITLIYSLDRPYRKKASFIMNDKTIAAVRKLKDNNGSYLWQPSYQADEPDRLLGYPIYTSAFAPENAIAFGDYSYYNIGDRGARAFQELRELFAGNGMTGFIARERVDAKLVLPEAVKILPIKAATAGA